jgi:predicted ribosome quality control (RQC) complex YloA/Tae2 family protein
MTKDNVVTFEELFRLLQDRQRYIAQKEEALTKIQSLTNDLEKAKGHLEGYNNLIATGETKIRAIGKELGEK